MRSAIFFNFLFEQKSFFKRNHIIYVMACMKQKAFAAMGFDVGYNIKCVLIQF